MSLTLDRSDRQLLRRPNAAQVQDAAERRGRALAVIEAHGSSAFGGSKPHLGALSPGCQRCGEGEWSCLFLNAVCHAGCFFCPGQMTHPDAPPHAERLVFEQPEDYAAYIERLGFRGVSFSGGEPFLAGDRMVRFIKALRERLGDALTIWAYSNGVAVRDGALERAVAAGLDEVRFNIAHADYKLTAVRRAVAVAPRVTVEIPAVPEDLPKLRAALPALVEAGVRHLNLHQLMMVGDNAPQLIERNYTFLDGPVPAVLESELAALETMAWAAEQGIALAINYCGLAYKSRWQNRAEDLRAGALLCRPWETQTETGYTRQLTIALGAEPDETLRRLAARGLVCDDERIDRKRGVAMAGLDELGPARALGLGVSVQYFKTVMGEAEIQEQVRRRADYAEIEVTSGKKVGVRRIALCAPTPLSDEALDGLRAGTSTGWIAACKRNARGLAPLVAAAQGTAEGA